jgi:DNA-binding NtrC family response regulator
VAGSGARTILITGPSGTGKDVVARAIHFASPEADRPFLNITCTALPEALLESELFGHEKGAFTDAKQQKRGLLEEADGGTVFLDEIGDMPPSLQAKMLRFLESKSFRRIGGLREIKVEVRVIAATHRNLPEAIAKGAFRSDLYYRLNVIPIEIAPLQERPDDVPPLLDHFVQHYAREIKKEMRGFDETARDLLVRHPWPGNVRELRNCVERAVLLATGPVLTTADLPPDIRRSADAGRRGRRRRRRRDRAPRARRRPRRAAEEPARPGAGPLQRQQEPRGRAARHPSRPGALLGQEVRARALDPPQHRLVRRSRRRDLT